MKKVFKVSISVLCMIAMLMMGTTAFAATIENIEFNATTGYMTIEGKLDYSGDAAVYTAYYDKDTETYLLDGVYQTTSNSDNEFTITIPVVHLNRFIKVVVSGMDYRETNAIDEKFYYDEATYDDALAMLKDIDTIADLLEEEEYQEGRDVLALDYETLALITNKTGIYQDLVAKANSYDDLKSNFSEWKDYYSFLVAANAIGQAASESQAYEIYSKKKDALKVANANYYALYSEQEGEDGETKYSLSGYEVLSTYESAVINGLRGSNYETEAEFLKKFDESMVLNVPKYLVYWVDITNALKLFSAILTDVDAAGTDIDFAGYNALGTKAENVDEALSGKIYTTILSLVQAYNAAVGDQEEGGGGEGGSFGGTAIGGPAMGSVGTISVENTTVNTNGTAVNPVFSDMADYDWAKEAVAALNKKGYVAGYGDNEFRPGNNITRGEFVKILCKIFALSASENAMNPFTDIAADDWQYEYVLAALESGIVNGKSADYFGVNELISRQEMAVMAYRAMEKSGFKFGDEKTEFEDQAAIADWAKEQVSTMSGLEILTGYQNKFNPEDYATRAEAACMLYRVMNAL